VRQRRDLVSLLNDDALQLRITGSKLPAVGRACITDDELGTTTTLPIVLGLLRTVEQHGAKYSPAIRREGRK
jgi:hypothetical protein